MHDPIDEQLLIQHTAIGYTMKELAALTGVSVDTLERNYAEVIKRGRELRNASLRRKQFELAMSGNAVMCIWLGKQYLAQKDKAETTGNIKHEHSVDLTRVSATTLAELRERATKDIISRDSGRELPS